MVRAKRKTDKGVWSGVEGGITARGRRRLREIVCAYHFKQQEPQGGRHFHLKGSVRQKLDGSSHMAEMHFIHLEAIPVELQNRNC